MANFATDGKICIEREIETRNVELATGDDLIPRFNVLETCKWITKNNFNKVRNANRNSANPMNIIHLNLSSIEKVNATYETPCLLIVKTSHFES